MTDDIAVFLVWLISHVGALAGAFFLGVLHAKDEARMNAEQAASEGRK